jgi:hypothetical protein
VEVDSIHAVNSRGDAICVRLNVQSLSVVTLHRRLVPSKSHADANTIDSMTHRALPETIWRRTSMLSHQKKAAILVKTGMAVPPYPVPRSPILTVLPGRDWDGAAPAWESDPEQVRAVAAWNRTIDGLFVDYAAARAAKSLRDSEQALQLERLRRANSDARSA